VLSGVAGVRAAATRAALGRGTFLGSRTARTAELALVRRACVRARTAELRRRRGASSRGRAVVRSSWETRHVRMYIRTSRAGRAGRRNTYPLKRVQYFNIAKRCMPLQPIDVYIRTHHTHSVPNLSLTRESIRYYIHLYIPRERAEMPARGHTFSIAQTDGVAHLLTLPASSGFAFYIPPHYFTLFLLLRVTQRDIFSFSDLSTPRISYIITRVAPHCVNTP